MDARKKELPSRPNLEQYKKQAKDLVRAFKSADSDTLQRVEKSHPHAENLLSPNILKAKFALADAQLIVARGQGFDGWPKLAKRFETLKRDRSAASGSADLGVFIEAASVPLDANSTGMLG